MDIIHKGIGVLGVLGLFVALTHNVVQLVIRSGHGFANLVRDTGNRLEAQKYDAGTNIVPLIDFQQLGGPFVQRVSPSAFSIKEFCASSLLTNEGGANAEMRNRTVASSDTTGWTNDSAIDSDSEYYD